MKKICIIFSFFYSLTILGQDIQIGREQLIVELNPMVIGNRSFLSNEIFSSTSTTININYGTICSNVSLNFSTLNTNQRGLLNPFGGIVANNLTTTSTQIQIRNLIGINDELSFQPIVRFNQTTKESIINASTTDEVDLGTFSISVRFRVKRFIFLETYSYNQVSNYHLYYNRNTGAIRNTVIITPSATYEYPVKVFDKFKIITKSDNVFFANTVNSNPFTIDRDVHTILSNNYQIYHSDGSIGRYEPLKIFQLHFFLTSEQMSNSDLMKKIGFEGLFTVFVFYLNSSGIYLEFDEPSINKESDRLNILIEDLHDLQGITASPLFGGYDYDSSNIKIDPIRSLTTLAHEIGHSLGLSHEIDQGGIDDFSSSDLSSYFENNIMCNYSTIPQEEDINNESFDLNNIYRFNFTVGQLFLLNYSKCSLIVNLGSYDACNGTCSNCNCNSDCPPLNLN